MTSIGVNITNLINTSLCKFFETSNCNIEDHRNFAINSFQNIKYISNRVFAECTEHAKEKKHYSDIKFSQIINCPEEEIGFIRDMINKIYDISTYAKEVDEEFSDLNMRILPEEKTKHVAKNYQLHLALGPEIREDFKLKKIID